MILCFTSFLFRFMFQCSTWNVWAAGAPVGCCGDWVKPSSAVLVGSWGISGPNIWEQLSKLIVRNRFISNRSCMYAWEWHIIIHADPLSGPLRPSRLLVFINPLGGKKKGRHIYDSLAAPLFELAGISCHVIGKKAHQVIRRFKVKAYCTGINVFWISLYFEVIFLRYLWGCL